MTKCAILVSFPCAPYFWLHLSAERSEFGKGSAQSICEYHLHHAGPLDNSLDNSLFEVDFAGLPTFTDLLAARMLLVSARQQL